MAVPVIIALFAFLTGAGGATTAAPWLLGAVKGEAVVAGVYADLPTLCKATDVIIDTLGDTKPKSAAMARVVRVADAVCAAAAKPNNPIDQAALIVGAIGALRDPAVVAVMSAKK